MINLFPHDKKADKEFTRLNTLIQRQAHEAKRQKDELQTANQKISELSQKVK